jgi:hypothetical protein
VPAPRSPFLYLLTDLWIAISWLLLIGTGLIFVLLFLLFQHSTPPSAFKIFAIFLVTGYIVWSTYFGLAACWRLALSMLTGTASMWIAIVVSMLPPGWIMFAFAFIYAWLGGGIYQFARRWWLLAHGQQPPFLTASRRVQHY